MCGISGIVQFNGNQVPESEIRKMMNQMKHRGPDDEGVFIENGVGFGFVRLSILDLSDAGHQPMFSHDGRYVMIFNGEVYNYLELRSKLSSRYTFRSGTDTEVILAAYQEWGVDCLEKFNGMFALVIFDRENNEIFGARDRFGIKPLYYSLDAYRFIFASEVKSLLPQLKNRLEPNDRVLSDYLLYNRTDHTEETFFKNVLKLNHGCYFKLKGGELSFKKWYDLTSKLSDTLIGPEQYRELLKESLKFRLRSDVPVGVCLSGGLDSSAIAASLVNDFNLNALNTFSAVYDENESADESYFIKKFSSSIKNMHYTYPTGESFYNDYLKFIEAHNEPVPDTGPYAQYKVMELATKHVTVTLDGQGADEQLGGYHYFFGSYYVELLRKLKLFRLLMENYHYLRIHRSINAGKYFLYYLLPEWGQRKINKKLYPSVNLQMESTSHEDSINQMLYNPNSLRTSLIQHFEFKLEHLLRWEDLNSMTFSIESRVPFLDHRIVESTLSLPSESIIQSGISKYILRESVKDIVPAEIYARTDKKGFSNPREKWFRTKNFQTMIWDLLHSEKFRTRGYFNADIAKKRYKMHLESKADISKEIWKWINTEVWFNRFIDN